MSYDEVFSAIYQKKFTQFATNVSPRLHLFIETNNKLEKNLLDVCCGTGDLANYFLDKGYEVTGIDISDNMLDYAKRLNKDYIENESAFFYCKDASDFVLEGGYSVAVSTYDALNHLMSKEKLLGCFKSIYNAVEDGGIFIFDLNTIKGLSEAVGTHLNNTKTEMHMTQNFYNTEKNRAKTVYSGFVKLKNHPYYVKYDTTVSNQLFVLKEVKELLMKVGWTKVSFRSVDDLDTVLDKPENENRVFVIANK